MKTDIEKLPHNAFSIHTVIEKDAVDTAYADALAHEAEHTEVKGFRKGKAPLDKVKEAVDPAALRSHALNHLLSDAYMRIVKENHLQPILDPRFMIKVFEEGKDLEVDIIIIERPAITLGDYTGSLKQAHFKKNVQATTATDLTNEEIIQVLLDVCEIGIAAQLIEEETNRMMTTLIDQTARLGITVEQYLEANKKTPEQLRKEYEDSAEKTLKAEFLLTELAMQNKISISDDEITKTIAAVPDEASRKLLEQENQKVYITAILVKGKTLDMLRDIASGKVEGASTSKKEEKTDDTK